MNRSHHPFFLGRKASISKKAFGRIFIFSFISSKVLASSSDSPLLHLVDDERAQVYFISRWRHVCSFEGHLQVSWGGSTLSVSVSLSSSLWACEHIMCVWPDVLYLSVHMTINMCPCKFVCGHLLFHEVGHVLESLLLTRNGGRAVVL